MQTCTAGSASLSRTIVLMSTEILVLGHLISIQGKRNSERRRASVCDREVVYVQFCCVLASLQQVRRLVAFIGLHIICI